MPSEDPGDLVRHSRGFRGESGDSKGSRAETSCPMVKRSRRRKRRRFRVGINAILRLVAFLGVHIRLVFRGHASCGHGLLWKGPVEFVSHLHARDCWNRSADHGVLDGNHCAHPLISATSSRKPVGRRISPSGVLARHPKDDKCMHGWEHKRVR